MTIELDQPFTLPVNFTSSPLLWFGITLLLATPSALDNVKNDDIELTRLLNDAGVPAADQTAALGFIHSVVNDPTTQGIMASLHNALLNRPSTAAVYTQPICPSRPDSVKILNLLK